MTQPHRLLEIPGYKRKKMRLPKNWQDTIRHPGTGTVIIPDPDSGHYGVEEQAGGAGVRQRANHVLWAEAVIEDVATELRKPVDEVRRLVWSFGRVCQNRLLQGKTCGLPYVGELRIHSIYRMRQRVAGLRRRAERRARQYARDLPPEDAEKQIAFKLAAFDHEYAEGNVDLVVVLNMTKSLRTFYREHVNRAFAVDNRLEIQRLRAKYGMGTKRKAVLNPYVQMTKEEYREAMGVQWHPSGRRYRLRPKGEEKKP